MIPGCSLVRMSTRARTIGEVAAEAGVSPDTLRYYERLGLLPNVVRRESGYRLYTDAAVERVHFIRNALRFGFALKEVAGFFQACESGRPPCRQVRDSAQDILSRVDRQIKELTTARRAIRKTLADWDLRLSTIPPGKPARLLQSLDSGLIPTDCLSVRLKRKPRN
jgi:DNA-binding transcriptional MerR regulator